jgi:translation initiation factor 2 beta subunit (eIF-2beta)/eIF-5
VTSGGGTASGGRSTTSRRGCSQGGMPPPIEGSSGHPKRKHGAVSGTGESGSTASQSSAKRPRKFTSSDEKLSDLARIRLRKEACDFFSKNSMQFLEQTYLSSGNAGLDSLKKHLLNLFLLALGSDDEYLRDKKILHYQDRVQDIVQEAIFNPIACYAGVFKSLPIVESAKPDLLLKIERFLAKAGEVKGKGRKFVTRFPSLFRMTLRRRLPHRIARVSFGCRATLKLFPKTTIVLKEGTVSCEWWKFMKLRPSHHALSLQGRP